MRLKPRLAINPIIVKELRSRMRGARAFVVLTGTLLLMGAASYALYRIVLATSPLYATSPLSPQIGQTLFSGLAFLELMMVCFVTPAVTAGAISSEREKLTYEMLLATPLRPSSILWGKLISDLSYVLLLIFAAIPMASLVFIFGGVTPRDMIKALAILMAVAMTLGVVGIFMSTWLGRTGRATVLSYLVVLALLIGPLFVYVLVGVLRQEEPPRWILVPNPMSALFSALTPAAPGDAPASLFWGLGMVLGGNLRVLSDPGQAGLPRPLYHYTLPLYGAIALVLYLLATRLVHPTRRWRLRWVEILTFVTIGLAFIGSVALAFAITGDRYDKVGVFATPTPARVMIQPFMEQKAIRVEPALVAPPTPVPTPPPQPISPLPTATLLLSEDDQAAIYVAIVRHLYTVDHVFGDQAPEFPVLYLVRTTDDRVGDPGAPRAEPRLVPQAVQETVLAALTAQPNLPAKIVWVADQEQVSLNANSEVEGNGPIFTLGNIHQQLDGSALVSASVNSPYSGGRGKTYILRILDGFWQIVGDTGVEWIN